MKILMCTERTLPWCLLVCYSLLLVYYSLQDIYTIILLINQDKPYIILQKNLAGLCSRPGQFFRFFSAVTTTIICHKDKVLPSVYACVISFDIPEYWNEDGSKEGVSTVLREN